MSGLAAIRLLDKIQGHLHRNFKSIHVTGTNGKGSVCYKIALALQKEGYKVGLYTSPHIHSFCERIRVNGQMISEQTVERLLPSIMNSGSGSFFDYTTALAFAYFAEQKIDFAVLEVGIGGRFDATNVVNPVLSIITSVHYDHMDLLGYTLEEIVYEKAGIIKEGVPYLLGPRVPFLEGPRAPIEESGFYDRENSLIAQKALNMLGVSEKSIAYAISKRPPCRFEILYGRFVLDAAHNPDAIAKLIAATLLYFPDKKLHFMVGFSSDKEVGACLELLSQVGSLTCVGGDYPRLLSSKELAALAKNTLGFAVSSRERIDLYDIDADVIVICGSFYLMVEARKSIEDWGISRGLDIDNDLHATV